jgi:thioredoxin reductase (NADPH)
VFIGADPCTGWLAGAVDLDLGGYVLTGQSTSQSKFDTLARRAFMLETSSPGVFAAGDVRSGSIKRLTSAVGEGAMVVRLVHEHLPPPSSGYS